MTKSVLTLSVACLGVFFAMGRYNEGGQGYGPGSSGETKESGPAPDFTAKDARDVEWTLSKLTNKPLFLYFFAPECGVNEKAIDYFDKLASAYKDSVNFVGVFRGSAKNFWDFRGKHKISFNVLIDPGRKIISDYGAKRSVTLVQVGTDKTIQGVWNGYSADSLKKINEVMAEAGKVTPKNIDFSVAPTQTTIGCPL